MGLALQVLELEVSTLLIFRAALEQPNARGEMLNWIVYTVLAVHTLCNKLCIIMIIMQSCDTTIHYASDELPLLSKDSYILCAFVYIQKRHYITSHIFSYLLSTCPAALSFQCIDQTWSNIIEPRRYLATHHTIHILSLYFTIIYQYMS